MSRTPRTKKRNRQVGAQQRRFLRVTVLLVIALLTHSFDYCAAHVGVPDARIATASAVPHFESPCHDAGSRGCTLCAPVDKPHSDCCDPLTEIAVLTAQTHHAQFVVMLVPAPSVVPPAPQLFALSGSLHGRAEPPPAPFLTSVCRLSLPDRAPPISA